MRKINKKTKNKEWDELCEYVKKEILNYDDNMKFPTYLALKLQGLKKGQHIANNNANKNANYDDYTLLCAFKICKPKIINYLNNNYLKIKDEQHKINLIVKMVEPVINDVYVRIQQTKMSEERVIQSSFENQYNKGADYKKKTKAENDRLKELW
ncbi:hypothetical protein [Anaerovorax sp. IOR16]|uniref:hypothetical protein n=1 Tax=Anaerovorax sp. IOR16 TaxID=2773458 RepID=UPI0019D204C7|nr:hypothetical protein [Anaerovorax sp. IOR16]